MKNTSLQSEKIHLRESIIAQIAAFEDAYIASSNKAIFEATLALPTWQKATTVFIYASVGREVDTHRLIAHALQAGKTVCVPQTLAGGHMHARRIHTQTALKPARFGLLEPENTALLVPPECIDLIVAPCVACDKEGRRLGHGGGYYDRFLLHTSAPILCLCRERLLQTALPEAPHDKRVNMVLTESAAYGLL